MRIMKINYSYDWDKTVVEITPKTGDDRFDLDDYLQEIPDELYQRYLNAVKEYEEVQNELRRLNDIYFDEHPYEPPSAPEMTTSCNFVENKIRNDVPFI